MQIFRIVAISSILMAFIYNRYSFYTNQRLNEPVFYSLILIGVLVFVFYSLLKLRGENNINILGAQLFGSKIIFRVVLFLMFFSLIGFFPASKIFSIPIHKLLLGHFAILLLFYFTNWLYERKSGRMVK
jgi:hypothetical protein